MNGFRSSIRVLATLSALVVGVSVTSTGAADSDVLCRWVLRPPDSPRFGKTTPPWPWARPTPNSVAGRVTWGRPLVHSNATTDLVPSHPRASPH